MPAYRPPVDDAIFLIRDVFQIDKEWKSWSSGNELDIELAQAILTECGKLATEVLDPLSSSGDKEGAHFEDGEVRAPSGFQQAMQRMVEGGWIGLSGDPQYGGQGMPKSIGCSMEEFFWGTNSSLWLYAGLTLGASFCINSHANQDIKSTYLPAMYEGKWLGAMALTEPHAGTDLGMLRTKAELMANGTYRINGLKIFITSGEHDLSENIVHMVLARIEGAPEGVRGISLFLVPKFLVNEDGSLGERNGLASISIEEKMGIHGSATSTIVYENAEGYLIGEPDRGLSYMFTMMNFARVSVGLQGLGLAERAYQLASDYAKERLQGRSATGPTNTEGPADPLIEHADVRRMLLTQRSYTEGSRAFAIFTCHQLDLMTSATKREDRDRARRFVELLTPMAKAFVTDRAMESVLLAQQCFGGHGYIRETGIEQIVRDTRISQIYEGTNGIQALDLIGRKVTMNGGESLQELIDHMSDRVPESDFSDQVFTAMKILENVTKDICAEGKSGSEFVSAVAVDYMELCGHTIYAWLWNLMAVVDSEGSLGKLELASYFFDKLMPMSLVHSARIRSGYQSVLTPHSDWF